MVGSDAEEHSSRAAGGMRPSDCFDRMLSKAEAPLLDDEETIACIVVKLLLDSNGEFDKFTTEALE